MKIEIYGSKSAAQMEQARALVDEALAETKVADAEVLIVPVEGPEDARAKRSLGTPTVRVNGVDIEYAEREPEEYTNGGRYYATADGWKPLPERGMIIRAITAARAREARNA